VTREELYQRAEVLAGRKVDLIPTPNGDGFIVIWIAYGEPLTSGATEEETLQNFISRLEKREATLKEETQS
jgi:hypothetical protein